jgi:L-iditol 2-dehydrogenase
MNVAKLYSFHDIRIEDMSVPETGNGDVLVRVKACGICSGDVMPWYIEKKATNRPGLSLRKVKE